MIRAYSLYIAWIVTLASVFISVYIGEIKGIEPCALCWYQRICLYPLSILLPIAIYRQDIAIKIYILPQLVIGVFLSSFQYLKQLYPSSQITLCRWGKDCSEVSYSFLGHSLAFWSLLSFCLLTILVLISKNISSFQKGHISH